MSASALAIVDTQELSSNAAAAAVTTVVRHLRDHPLSGIVESILRTIASMFYREGVCYARQATIARIVGRAKSTVQLALDELENRGLICRTVREGTSHLIHLADGVIEALRELRLERRARTLRAQGIPKLSGLFAKPKAMPPAPMQEAAPMAALPPPPVVHVPVETPAEECVEREVVRGSFAVEPEPMTRKNGAVEVVGGMIRPKAPTEPRRDLSNVISSIHTESSSRAYARANEHDVSIKVGTENVVEKLLNEGLTPPVAHAFAQLFDADRILRNIRIGLHREKRNPPGYLVSAIRHDYAAAHLQPGSEADNVRRKEQQRSLPPREASSPTRITSPITPPPPQLEEDYSQKFQALPPEQRAVYEEQAHQTLSARLGSIATKGAAYTAMLKARAITLFRREQPTVFPNTWSPSPILGSFGSS